MMTPETLLYLRQQRRLTRDQLAEDLGIPSGSTINKWERGINPIPEWVAEKMYRSLPIELTVEELGELYDICRDLGIGMHQLIAEALRPKIQERLRQRELKAKPPVHYITGEESLGQSGLNVAEDPPKP